MPELARHVDAVPPSGIRRVYELAVQLPDVLMLAIGEPDVEPAEHIARAAQRAWDEGATDYTPNGGIPAFRQAVVDKLARDNGLRVDVEQVWSTVGATQALFQALGLVLDAGDEVLIPDPGYTTFPMGARMLHAEPVRYALRPEHGFLPDVAELETLVTERTRALIVNTPSNPLGVVFPEATVRELLAFARRHDLWVISDEVYERFAHTRAHVSPAALDEDDRVLSVFSLSKTYAMTGIRAGWLVTPPGLTEVMRRVQEAQISCINTPAQYAAVAALTGPQDAVGVAAAHYRENIRLATQLLRQRGIRHHEPEGAFYLWIDVSHVSGGDVAAWAERFVLEQRVAVAPGSAFGRTGEGWIRVCAASPTETLLEGLRRLPSPV
ncbi:pyridoxal phosphate-dependent aminotransferase [Gryllotalpicola ginsengisoli]|uniref:pyridoxal phosphate-dependent aminotransferase n=1 Tax=Gryllotalpicola ginsengisoli TaxID=444608 RepID=UPI0003B5A5D4|nr:aminotransferase class I/II-fold pyridoxal phosphate-dependent enzyme [Gryllotalpicola ginsengisoli]